MKLKNKTVLVTGGTRGIGLAIAKAMQDDGANVILTYHCDDQSAEEASRALNDNVAIFSCDQRSMKDISQLVTYLKENNAPIDILVNNAGINRPNDFDAISESDWDDVLDTNLKGPFMISQKLMPLLRDNGSIINIASVSGQYGGPRTTHYAASKAGLIAMTQNMAIFFAKKNIRVNCIAPGLIDSDMAKAANDLNLDDKILLKRFGKPEEVGRVAAFLASDDASYMTAQTINVNGGLYF